MGLILTGFLFFLLLLVWFNAVLGDFLLLIKWAFEPLSLWSTFIFSNLITEWQSVYSLLFARSVTCNIYVRKVQNLGKAGIVEMLSSLWIGGAFSLFIFFLKLKTCKVQEKCWTWSIPFLEHPTWGGFGISVLFPPAPLSFWVIKDRSWFWWRRVDSKEDF